MGAYVQYVRLTNRDGRMAYVHYVLYDLLSEMGAYVQYVRLTKRDGGRMYNM